MPRIEHEYIEYNKRLRDLDSVNYYLTGYGFILEKTTRKSHHLVYIYNDIIVDVFYKNIVYQDKMEFVVFSILWNDIEIYEKMMTKHEFRKFLEDAKFKFDKKRVTKIQLYDETLIPEEKVEDDYNSNSSTISRQSFGMFS